MATAAPAAPSTSAPAESAQPVTGDAAPQTLSDTPAAPDTVQKLRGPARPIPRLPGVVSDDDGSFPPPPPAPSSGPARGPDGRFVSGATPASDTPSSEDHTLEPATPTPPTPSKFKFADVEFESQAAAEQNFKSLRGQFRPIQALAREVGGIDKIVPTLSSAAESARGWKARADALESELSEYRSGRQPSAASSTAQPPTVAPAPQSADSVDWELYAEVKKLATDQGEPWKAEQWLIQQVQQAQEAKYQKLLDERLAPLDQAQAHGQVVAQTEALFGQLAEYTNADGSVAFPELHDEQAAYEVGQLWAQLGLPPEAALTPQGAVAAIALYRQTRGASVPARPTTPPAAPVAPATPEPATDTAAAAALSPDGRPLVASIGAPGTPSAEAARILQGLRSVSQPGRSSMLGFEA